MTLHSPRENVRDQCPLWRWMQVFVVIASLNYFVVALTCAITWGVYARVLALPLHEATLIDQVTLWSSRGLIWVLLVCAFATLRVAYRLTHNLEVRGGSSDLPSAGWVCGSFFVPIANLIMPPLLISRVWRETFASTAKPSRGSGIIGWWWAAWIGSAALMLADRFLLRELAPHSPLTPELRNIREVYWGTAALGYGIRGACCWLLLAAFGALVRGQSGKVDVSAFD